MVKKIAPGQVQRSDSWVSRKRRPDTHGGGYGTYGQPPAMTHAAPRRGWSRGTSEPVMMMPPTMPQLGQGVQLQGVPTAHGMAMQALAAQQGAAYNAGGLVLTSTGQLVPAGTHKKPGSGVLAVAGKKTWRYRWQLAPVAVTGAIMAGASIHAPNTLGALVVTGAAAAAAEKWGDPNTGERPWLSLRERRIAWQWAAGASVWVGGVALSVWDPASAFGILALAGMTGRQGYRWLKSRRIRPASPAAAKPELGENTLQLIAAWDNDVRAWAPDPLVGSQVLAAEELDGGTIVLTVQTRANMHAEKAVTDECRRYLERSLQMGIGTVRLEVERDHAGLLKVILTPTRHLEKTSKVWEKPLVHDDGRLPVAVTSDGQLVHVQMWGETGVRHMLIVGSSNAGKSNTYMVVLTPTVLAGHEVMFYLDGKKGTSGAKIAAVMDLVARNPRDWERAIDIAYAVLEAREDRYGAMGIDEFHVGGPDPILSLVLDEGSTIAGKISAGHNKKIEEIAERGRGLGVCLRIGVQRPHLEGFPGGGSARDNVMGANGSIIALRPGGTQSESISLASTGENIDLMALPKGGGWCAIVVEGEIVSREARVLYIPDYALLAKHLKGFIARSLNGSDLAAAGPAYASRTTGRAWLSTMASEKEKHGYADEYGGGAPAVPETAPAGVDMTKPAAERAENGGLSVEVSAELARALGGRGIDAEAVLAILSGLAPATADHQVLVEEDPAEDLDELDVELDDEEPTSSERLADIASYVVHKAQPASQVVARVHGAAAVSAAGAAARMDTVVTQLRLAGARGLTKRELQEALKVSESAVKRYLRDLRNAGVIETVPNKVDAAGRHYFRLAEAAQAA